MNCISSLKFHRMKTEVLTNSANRAGRQAGKEETELPIAGKTAGTILLAIAFLALVMCLSYLCISGTK
jgi:hypothetical protein